MATPLLSGYLRARNPKPLKPHEAGVPLDSRPVFQLAAQVGRQWENLEAADAETRVLHARLNKCVEKATSDDVSFVVFGSAARYEVTQGSDVDWTLLVDGQSDPEHFQVALQVEAELAAAGIKDPGREGTFGGLAFSHEILHRIGGADDSNRNTTQRILLLLESAAIGRPEAYDRVIRNVLARYINEDWGWSHRRGPAGVPRFLQNDIARYWRTVAVDFAYKRRDRGGRGWALRTVKLRVSRKLTYAAGLLACFSCDLEGILEGSEDEFDATTRAILHLQGQFAQAPLDVLAGLLLKYPQLQETGIRAIEAYDRFLAILNDGRNREHLEQLEPQASASDTPYEEAREVGHQFQEGLDAIFFGAHQRIAELTRIYGVF